MTALVRVALAATALLLGGCASLQVDQAIADASEAAKIGVSAQLLATEAAQANARREADAALAAPLTADAAVRLAIAYSPATQTTLYEAAIQSAQATQSARLPNPIFTFDHLVRRGGGEVEKEIGRMLSFSVIDILLLPGRMQAADYRQQQLRLNAASELVRVAAETRQAWVRAVAAEQSVAYARQVKDAAGASAELARRMQSVGNFNRLQRAREQAFYADAVAQLARAQHAAKSAREALVRLVGLDAQQAARLKFPERLPDLPAAAREEETVVRSGLEQRLDVRLAKAELDYVAREQGLTRITSFVDGLQVAAVRNSETGLPVQKGYEVELPLPIFDFGDARRAQAQATYMAALNRAATVGVNATSQLREDYSAYRTAFDLARHYRDEVVPLRKSIADENMLRYNGMLIGVFELLADAREQIGSVVQAIDAQRDFWLADAALQASLTGRALSGAVLQARSTDSTAQGGGH